MEKISYFVETKLNHHFGRFVALPFVKALNRSFMALMPLVLLGSFATLLAGLAWGPYQTLISDSGIKAGLILINNLSLNLYALWLAGALGYHYSQELKLTGYELMMAFIAMFAILLLTNEGFAPGSEPFSFEYLGARGLFGAMIVTAMAVRLFGLCRKFKLYFKMPGGVASNVARSFEGLVPLAIITLVLLLLERTTIALGFSGINGMIYDLISRPLSLLSTNPVSLVILLLLPWLFWFFGIHGAAATAPIIPPLLIPAALENAIAYASGNPVPHMFAMGILNLGGVLAMVWALVCLTSRKIQLRSLGRLALVPSVFGVFEPVNFGIPIVMNPYLLIPQLLIVAINLILMFVLMEIGLLPYPHSMYVWGLPVFVSGFIQSGIMGIFYQVAIIGIDYLVILPFFRAYEKSLDQNAPDFNDPKSNDNNGSTNQNPA